MMTVDHIVLTRFNLPSAGAESLIRAQEGWLRDRIQLFERYTIPSMSAQTVRASAWFVYLDPQSPEWLRERMKAHAASRVLIPIYREMVSREDIIADAERQGLRRNDTVITTNLDNDDGLAFDFLERLQRLPVGTGRAALYLSTGLISSGQAVYLRHDPVNAFCSVREPWAGAVTCWVDWHNLLPKRMPAVNGAGAPAWLQVVHGANVSNRVRGRLVDPTVHGALFGTQLGSVPRPSPARLMQDRWVGWPLRQAREHARGVVKTAVMSIGGKGGLEQVRNRARALGALKITS